MPKISVNDIEIYYELRGIDAPGTPMVLITGVGRSINFWEPAMLDYLSRHFPVLIFDNRGAGQSSMPDEAYTVEMFAADTLALIEAVGLARPHVVGHSLGATIALELGRLASERIGKVIGMSMLYPGPTLVMPSERTLQIMIDRSGEPRDLIERGLRIALSPGFEQRHPDRFRAMVEEGLNRTQPPNIYVRQSQSAMGYVQEDKLAHGFAPDLCLIYGEHDEVTQPGNGTQIQANVPETPLYIIPATGHLLPAEQPHLVADIITTFLGGYA